MMPNSPMGMIGQPQQMLAQGVSGGGPAGAGPTIPQQMMPPPGPGIGMGGIGMQQLMQDPRALAYINALRGGPGGLTGALPGG